MRRLLLLAAVLWLVGCGEEMKSGQVIAKDHESARTYVMVLPVYTGQTCVKIGQTNSCTNRYIYMPFTLYDDEDWKLRVENDEGKQGWVYVTPDVWERKVIGDWWSKVDEGGGYADPTAKV